MMILFNYLSLKRNDLILLWLRISNEIPPSDAFHLIGLSKRENKEFWTKENEYNLLYDKILKLLIIFITVMFNFSIFLDTYGYEPYIYIPFITIHFLHNSYYMYAFFNMVYFNIFFFLTILKFFTKKFDFIAKKLRKLSFENKNSDNRNLSEIIFSFEGVHLEAIKINDLFKHFIGINLVYFFFICVLCSFVAILVDNR